MGDRIPASLAAISSEPASLGFFESAREGCRRFVQAYLYERKWSPLAKNLVRAANICPPSLFDLEFLCVPIKSGTDFELVLQCMFLQYLLGLIELAEANALTLTSWSPVFRNLIWDLQKAFGTETSEARGR